MKILFSEFFRKWFKTILCDFWWWKQSSGESISILPSKPTIVCTTMSIHTTISMATQKLPLASLFSHLPSFQRRAAIMIHRGCGHSWNVSKGHWRREQCKVIVTEYSITHHWFFSTSTRQHASSWTRFSRCSSSHPKILQDHEEVLALSNSSIAENDSTLERNRN